MNERNHCTHKSTQTRAARPARVAPRRTNWRRLLRRGTAGMTLIEIMVVVIIMGLIASAVGFGVFNYLKRAKIKTTEQAIDVIRSAVRLYENDHPNQCPTVEQLQAEGFLDRNKSTTDAWGRPFVINCEGEDIHVSSNGPNGRPGDEDDIPSPASQGR